VSNVLANTIRRNSTCTLVEWKYKYILKMLLQQFSVQII